MIKFLTQGFTRGFFRNPDVRPAELKITRFPDTRIVGKHPALGAPFGDMVGNGTLHSAPPQSKEWLLEESAAMRRAMTHAPEFRLWTDEELQQAEAARLKYGKF